MQSLLGEVHALRVALEQNNRIGPRVQIVLARVQVQEERVRAAARDLQQARNQTTAIQSQRAESADRVKQLELRQSQAIDPAERRPIDLGIAGMKRAWSA